jgi:hypothetical protein
MKASDSNYNKSPQCRGFLRGLKQINPEKSGVIKVSIVH